MTPPGPGDLPAEAVFIAKSFSDAVVRQHLDQILSGKTLPDKPTALRL